MFLNTNIAGLIAANSIKTARIEKAQSSERISTTLRINSAKDDPAGLAAANRYAAKITSLVKVADNINLGLTITSQADSDLSLIASNLLNMRTLAISSSSGSTSSSTRSSNQSAFSTYTTEIDSIANSSIYNGSSLLNGNTNSITIQSGPESNNQTKLNFSSAVSSALGTGNSLAVSSLGSSTSDLSSLDLVINGVAIGATNETFDNASTVSKSGSAIAKAAAINLKTSLSNVEADVGETTASGSSMSVVGSDTTGTITINGIEISLSLSSANDIETNRAAVVSAVNNVSGSTGVKATDTFSSTKGVTLTASDGRNIAISHTTLASGNTGLASDGTYGGKFTLRSLDQSNIVISSQATGNILNADLNEGIYSSNLAQVSSKQRSGSTSTPAFLTEGDLIINGVSVSSPSALDDNATVATDTSSSKKSSAISLAAAINRVTNSTNVTAVVNPNIVKGTSFTAGAVDTIFLNGITIGSAGLTSASSRSDVLNLLNSYSSQTGVVASDNGSGITLIATDGRNISIGVSDSGAAVNGNRLGLGGLSLTSIAATSATAMNFISTVKLTSDKVFTVSSGSNGYANFESLGFRVGTFGGSSDDTKVSELNISSQTGGSNAISTLDDALEMVSSMRAKIGAQQNSLNVRLNIASNSSLNASTAYGNIMNADLASEAVNLTAAQIKEDGATAMLAQANLNQNIVSFLLKQYTS